MSNALWMTSNTGEIIGAASVDASSSVLTLAEHGLAEQQQVTVASAAGGASVLVEGAPYWVRNASENAFELAPSPGAPVMEFAASGTVNIHHMAAVYTARDLRRFSSALMTPGSGGLTTTTGVRPGNPIATISSFTVTVNPFSGVVQPSGDDWPEDNGPYTFVVPSETALSVSPADSQQRIDSLVLLIEDHENDLGGVTDATVYIKEGTPGSGFPPALAEAEYQLATITVPTAGNPTLSDMTRKNTALGGIEPVSSTSQLPNMGLYEGRYADVANQDMLYRYNGSAWIPVASNAWARGVIADSGILTSSADFGTTEVVVRQASDAQAYFTTFNAEAGRAYLIHAAIEAVDKSDSGGDDDSYYGSKGSVRLKIRGGSGINLNTSTPVLAQVTVPVFDNSSARAGGAHFSAILLASTTGAHICGLSAAVQGSTSTARALRESGSPMNRIIVTDMGAML